MFLTRSMRPRALSDCAYHTSSQAYEVNLVRSLAAEVEVTVIYLGPLNDWHHPVHELFAIDSAPGCVRYFAAGPIRPYRILAMRRLFAELAETQEAVILTTGYYPWEVLSLALVRGRRVKTYSIVFDTHKQGNARMRAPKRWLADAYFQLGFFLLKFLSGIVVLNDAFIISRGLQFRYHKTRIGQLFDGKVPSPSYKRPRTRFLFAGTLNRDNGVHILLECLASNPDEPWEVCFFGYGELLESVEASSVHDPRIRYGGVLNDPDLNWEIMNSDCLVCLRDPESEVNEYAFPSKLIKFMGSGVPVICNVFPGLDPVYQEYVVLMKEYSIAALREAMVRASVDEEVRLLGRRSRAYIEKNHAWGEIASQMVRFLYGGRTH